jgi:hypothetical protein
MKNFFIKFENGCPIRSLEYCIAECESLIDQLLKYNKLLLEG